MILLRFFTDKNLIEFTDNIAITYYATCILSGVLLAMYLAIREGKRIGITKSFIYDGVLMCVPLALVGARIFYVLFALDEFDSFPEMVGIGSNGLAGLSITGGIIVAVIFVLVYARVHKKSVYPIFDILAPGLLVGQILGRWGNFFNREAHGGPIKNVEFMYKLLPDFIMNRMEDEYNRGVFYHPTFLYEGTWNFLGLLIILMLRRKKTKIRVGDFIGFYLMWYGFGRAVLIEPYRTDPLMFFDIRINVVFPLIFMVIGAVYLILKHSKKATQPYYYEHVQFVEDHKIKNFVFEIDSLFLGKKEDADELEALSYALEVMVPGIDLSTQTEVLKTMSIQEAFQHFGVEDMEEGTHHYESYLNSHQNHQFQNKSEVKPLIRALVREGGKVLIVSKMNQNQIQDWLIQEGIEEEIYMTLSGESFSSSEEMMKKVMLFFPNVKNTVLVTKEKEVILIANQVQIEVIYYADKKEILEEETLSVHYAFKTNQIYAYLGDVLVSQK